MTSSATYAIETFDLTRYFDQHLVVNRLNFRVPTGKVTALLGLNGAGKTTTIRMMMGLLDPTRGRCQTLGVDCRELTTSVLRRIGYLVEGHYLTPWMRVSEIESFSRSEHKHWDSQLYGAMVDHFGISTRQKVGKISRGQRAGVSLASVLAADPELLILDDPGLGLDPVSRRALNETLVDFAGSRTKDDRPRTVLLSTHLMDDVERIADEIAVMAGGRLLVHTTLDDLLSRVTRRTFTPREPAAKTEMETALRRDIAGLVECRFVADRCVLCVADSTEDLEDLVKPYAAGEIDEVPTSFGDLVVAYLSTQRSESFLNASTLSKKSVTIQAR